MGKKNAAAAAKIKWGDTTAAGWDDARATDEGRGAAAGAGDASAAAGASSLTAKPPGGWKRAWYESNLWWLVLFLPSLVSWGALLRLRLQPQVLRGAAVARSDARCDDDALEHFSFFTVGAFDGYALGTIRLVDCGAFDGLRGAGRAFISEAGGALDVMLCAARRRRPLPLLRHSHCVCHRNR